MSSDYILYMHKFFVRRKFLPFANVCRVIGKIFFANFLAPYVFINTHKLNLVNFLSQKQSMSHWRNF